MSKKSKVLGKSAKVKKFPAGGDPHFEGATPGALARALMRRTRPFQPAVKRGAKEQAKR